MPVCTSIDRKYPYGKYKAPQKYVLVLSCVDARLLDDLIRFLDHDNLTNRYYHVALAGAALGVVPESANVPNPFPHWRQVFIDHVQAIIELTEGTLTDIYIIQHQDCGAFKLAFKEFEDLPESAQKARNKQYAEALLKDITETFCTTFNPTGEEPKGNPEGTVQKEKPSVHTFYMDLRGNIELFETWPKEKYKELACANYVCQCQKPKQLGAQTVGAPGDAPEPPKPSKKPKKT